MNSKDIFTPNNEHLKCAPSKKFSEGSCFTVKSLKKLAISYNEYMGSKSEELIKIPNLSDNDLKKYLVEQLTAKITECGNDQICWLDLNWVKQTRDTNILKNTFRPLGPQARFKWLSTTNINEIMIQYEEKYNILLNWHKSWSIFYFYKEIQFSAPSEFLLETLAAYALVQ